MRNDEHRHSEVRLYGTPSLQELDQDLLRLHNPMDHNQSVEVMLHTTEDFQMFLMAHPDGYRELRDLNLIICAMVILSMCGGLHIKSIEKWQKQDQRRQEDLGKLPRTFH